MQQELRLQIDHNETCFWLRVIGLKCLTVRYPPNQKQLGQHIAKVCAILPHMQIGLTLSVEDKMAQEGIGLLSLVDVHCC